MTFYYLRTVQPMPGPQVGTGKPEVADRWLATACVVVEDSEAAAAPATTTERTKMRRASFIVGYPLSKMIDRKSLFLTPKW